MCKQLEGGKGMWEVFTMPSLFAGMPFVSIA